MHDTAFPKAVDAETAAREYFDEYSAVLHVAQSTSLPSSSSQQAILRPPAIDHAVLIEDVDALHVDSVAPAPVDRLQGIRQFASVIELGRSVALNMMRCQNRLQVTSFRFPRHLLCRAILLPASGLLCDLVCLRI